MEFYDPWATQMNTHDVNLRAVSIFYTTVN